MFKRLKIAFFYVMIWMISVHGIAQNLSRNNVSQKSQKDSGIARFTGKFDGFKSNFKNSKFGELLDKDGSFGPRFGNIVSGSGLAAGLRFGNDFIESSAAYSVKSYQEYDVQIGLNPPKEGPFLKAYYPRDVFRSSAITKNPGLSLYADLRYRNFPQEDFYGVGPDSLLSDRSDYRFEEASYNIVLGYQFKKPFRLDFKQGYLQPNVGPGTDRSLPNSETLFQEVSAPGLDGQPDFWQTGISAFYDYRDRKSNPHSGGAIGIMWLRYDDVGGNKFEFNRYIIDARQYIPIKTHAHILATRFYTSLSSSGAEQAVPFYLQDTLGGGSTLRGYSSYRFRDENLMLLSAEYRFEARKWLELAVFYDAGKVFSNASGFDLSGLKRGYGAGLRFKTPESILLRADVARSREGYAFYLSFGSSF